MENLGQFGKCQGDRAGVSFLLVAPDVLVHAVHVRVHILLDCSTVTADVDGSLGDSDTVGLVVEAKGTERLILVGGCQLVEFDLVRLGSHSCVNFNKMYFTQNISKPMMNWRAYL